MIKLISVKNICYLVLFTFSNLYSQVSFTNGETLIDLTHYSWDISALSAADLNNDGYKEIIVGSYYDNAIMIYKNINGNIQHYQRQILIQNPYASYYSDFDIYCAHIDNDDLIDIVVTHSELDKVTWYKNLGSYIFDNERVITTNIDKPKSLIVSDIDQDGDNDVIIGSENDKNVSLFKNSGNATFESKKIIYNTTHGVTKIKLFDLDNNGFLDIINGQENGSIYYSNNIDGSNFTTAKYITSSADYGTGFDFLDVNQDSYYDIVFSSIYEDNIKYVLNINGNSFSSEAIIIDNSLPDPYNLVVKDFDEDGLKDIIVSTTSEDKIGWYKNNNGYFSSIIQITDNVYNPKYFLIEDIDDNGSLDVISSSYQHDDVINGQKLSIFKKNITLNTYNENVINSYFSIVSTVRIADLNNDGNNDIISAFKSIMWNKNHGNNVFSSQLVLSSDVESSAVRDIEIKDMNSDGWLDIIGIVNGKLKVYKNNLGEQFELVHTQMIDYGGEDIEIGDLNGDNNFDILISHNGGEVPISKVTNNGDFDFQNISPVYTTISNGYKDYSFKCGDVDNDGDIDIVVGAKDIAEIHWLKNDGNGTFIYQFISSIVCDKIDIGDIDNDGYIDIIAANSYSYGAGDLNWLKKTSEGFLSPIKIDTQSLKSITLGDINNDGFLDILGTSYEYYSPYVERIFYYLFKDNSFQSQITIENIDAQSQIKDLALGDLNNDDKIDIVSSYYFAKSVKYFINSSSTLSLENINIENTQIFKIYPNPSSNFIHWNENLKISNISIFDSTGKLIYRSNKTITNEKLNVNFIPKGLYFIVAKSEKSKYTAKLIVK